MGDIAKDALKCPEELYKTVWIIAENIIDHTFGYEPCTIADIKRARPKSSSMGEGQVLQEPYTFEKARLVVR